METKEFQIKTAENLRKTVFTENGVFDIETSSDLLCADFISEAVARGIDKVEARRFIQNYSFNFSVEDTNVAYSKKGDCLLKRLPDWFYKLNVKLSQRLGHVRTNIKTGEKEIAIDIQRIARTVTKRKSIPGFRIPKNIPTEYKARAIEQTIDAVWRHEREHLLQKCDPNFAEQKRHEEKIATLLTTLGFGSASVPLILLTIQNLSPQTPNHLSEMAIYLPKISSGGFAIMGLSEVYKSKLSRSEKEARMVMRKRRANNTPIKVVNVK